jgi:RNA polymerase sigma-70 factor (ECF subfamily)
MDTNGVRSPDWETSDEGLMRRLSAGHAEAIGPLYDRYAGKVFGLAAATVGRASAEEIVQEVFLAVWRKARSYDPARGPFRAWVLRIAQRLVLNELRRRRRRPSEAADPDGLVLAAVADDGAGPAEVTLSAYRRQAVRSAVATLPPPQRQALSLAFFDHLTHEQIADSLGVPLGTTKSRIQAGMKKLRVLLTPLILVTLALTGIFGLRLEDEHRRTVRALEMVTRSDVVPRKLEAAPGVPPETHGQYRGRPGSAVAVLTLSHLAPAPSGQSYRAWSLHRGLWRSLGTAHPDRRGRALLIAEGAELASSPEAVRVTLERSDAGAEPSGPTVVAWPAP